MPLALTLGDPDGIGPEITGKAWTAMRGKAGMDFAVVVPGELPDFGVPTVDCTWEDVPVCFREGLPVIGGQVPGLTLSQQVAGSVDQAVRAVFASDADAVVTNPLSKDRLYKEGFIHPGHTEFLGELTKDAPAPYQRGPIMMLAVEDRLRVALVSIHESLRDMLDNLSAQRVERAALTLDGALRFDFGIPEPRIAMTGVNPHAGENGTMGREELDILNPTAGKLRGMGVDITDALSADALFHEEARRGYDAVLAMYHDQGLIPVKSLDFHRGVNITLGLPIVRTSPDHGTAFDIAGKGIAREDSLVSSIRMARRLADNRAAMRHHHIET